ncbi:MAG: hypothetical protein AABY65_04370 [Nitrospirota bacterium]
MSSRRTGWRRNRTRIAWAAMAVMFVLPVCAIESRAGGLPSAPRSDRPVPNAVGTQAESAKPSSPKSPAEAPKEPDDEGKAAGRIKQLARKGKCREAIEAADRFAIQYPNSPRLAGVLWDQAECHRSIARGGR